MEQLVSFDSPWFDETSVQSGYMTLIIRCWAMIVYPASLHVPVVLPAAMIQNIKILDTMLVIIHEDYSTIYHRIIMHNGFHKLHQVKVMKAKAVHYEDKYAFQNTVKNSTGYSKIS